MNQSKRSNAGFSLIELTIATAVILVMLGIVATIVGKSMSLRSRESRKADALASAKAALDVLSRELGNAGYGICGDAECRTGNNGLVTTDSNNTRIHFRTNLTNAGGTNDAPGASTLRTNEPGEDVTYFFDAATSSIVRYDPNDNPTTTVVVNRISNVGFRYFDYSGATSTAIGPNNIPTANTGRVQVTVTVAMDPVPGQPADTVDYQSDITLRNAHYMLRQY